MNTAHSYPEWKYKSKRFIYQMYIPTEYMIVKMMRACIHVSDGDELVYAV